MRPAPVRQSQQRTDVPGGRPRRQGRCEALSPYAASLVIKKLIAAVGMDPATYSGHSLRNGFLTSAAEAGAAFL